MPLPFWKRKRARGCRRWRSLISFALIHCSRPGSLAPEQFLLFGRHNSERGPRALRNHLGSGAWFVCCERPRIWLPQTRAEISFLIDFSCFAAGTRGSGFPVKGSPGIVRNEFCSRGRTRRFQRRFSAFSKISIPSFSLMDVLLWFLITNRQVFPTRNGDESNKSPTLKAFSHLSKRFCTSSGLNQVKSC